MNISIKNYNSKEFLPKFQEGGVVEAPVEDPNAAPAAPEAPQAGGEDPQAQLIAACQQAVETQDCQLAIQVCAAILQMMGGAPEAPAAPEGQQPVFKKGGKFSKWINK